MLSKYDVGRLRELCGVCVNVDLFHLQCKSRSPSLDFVYCVFTLQFSTVLLLHTLQYPKAPASAAWVRWRSPSPWASFYRYWWVALHWQWLCGGAAAHVLCFCRPKVLLCAGMCALAELVAAADSLHVCTGSDAIPLLWIGIWRLILDIRRQQLSKRVHIHI